LDALGTLKKDNFGTHSGNSRKKSEEDQ